MTGSCIYYVAVKANTTSSTGHRKVLHRIKHRKASYSKAMFSEHIEEGGTMGGLPWSAAAATLATCIG